MRQALLVGAAEADRATRTSDKESAGSRRTDNRGLDIQAGCGYPCEAHQRSVIRSAGLSTPDGLRLRTCVGDPRCADVTVSQKLLDGPDVVPRLEQVRRERVAKGVRAGALGDRGKPHGLPDRSLENRFVQMVATVTMVGTSRPEIRPGRGARGTRQPLGLGDDGPLDGDLHVCERHACVQDHLDADPRPIDRIAIRAARCT
jgi:hypothetical protein